MSENSDSPVSKWFQELVEKAIKIATDPDADQEWQNEKALTAADRTDPWNYYCRICGERDENENRVELMDLAFEHLKQAHPGRPNLGMDSSGRLIHVWVY